MYINAFTVALLLIPALAHAQQPISRIWLTHADSAAKTLTVSWETDRPAPSSVTYSVDGEAQGGGTISTKEVTLHHVTIDVDLTKVKELTYQVRSGAQKSAEHTVRGYTGDELRMVVVADMGYAKTEWTPAVRREKPHILLTAGDNVPDLHSAGRGKSPTLAFSQLIDRDPALFATTPFMPVLGNHDREIRPRGGDKPPAEPVYDVEATAYRSFFPLPDPGWVWRLDVEPFGLRLLALDLSHVQDHGTTWQTNHSPKVEDEQFNWYRKEMEAATDVRSVVTILNEKSSSVRGLEKGAWRKLIERGTLAVTGFGYYAERADVDGFPYFNTSVKGDGAKYPDPKAVVFASEHSYVLLTVRKGEKVRGELRNLEGKVIEGKAVK
ncbi:MAG: metallophosphoesterase [Phycisphaerae bacterium]|nr:metallophosphoesterase [Tepidisphaeraceae bacterium]